MDKPNNQISFYKNGNQIGVRFTKKSGEPISIAFISKNDSGFAHLKQNEHFPPLTTAEMGSIHKIMKEVEKGKHI